MKQKTLFLLFLLFISLSILSQTKVSQQEINNLFYAYGVLQTQGLDKYITNQGIDAKYKSQFVQGAKEGVSGRQYGPKPAQYTPARKAYDFGKEVGTDLRTKLIKYKEIELFGKECTGSKRESHLKQLANGFIDACNYKPKMWYLDAEQIVGQKSQAIISERLSVEFADNKLAGEKFLAENKQKPGIISLASGVQYKILKKGDGRIPRNTSKVKVRYEAKTIDGNVFDSSYNRGEPTVLGVNQVINGWTEILEIMPTNSTWEIYIPYELAYGERETGPIKPFSALIFKVELLSIEEY